MRKVAVADVGGTHARFALAHIDGKRVEYVGPLNDAGKDNLLGQAAALLMPILWDEPFGIVMAEALACGTTFSVFAHGW